MHIVPYVRLPDSDELRFCIGYAIPVEQLHQQRWSGLRLHLYHLNQSAAVSGRDFVAFADTLVRRLPDWREGVRLESMSYHSELHAVVFIVGGPEGWTADAVNRSDISIMVTWWPEEAK